MLCFHNIIKTKLVILYTAGQRLEQCGAAGGPEQHHHRPSLECAGPHRHSCSQVGVLWDICFNVGACRACYNRHQQWWQQQQQAQHKSFCINVPCLA